MRPTLAFTVAGLISLVVSEITLIDHNKNLPANISPLNASFGGDEVHVTVHDDGLWYSSVCRGAKLLLGMTLNEDQATRHVSPVNSPWDGTLEEEIETWGYSDVSHQRILDCDFEETNNLKTAFDALGIDTRDASQGGPNHCFTIFHRSGPAIERDESGNLPPLSQQYYKVNGRKYRVTNGYFTIGVNEQEGIVYFLNRASPDQQAYILWNRDRSDPILKDELPALRSSSDIAWGFWNRRSGHNLGFIRGFMSITIVNQETIEVIDMALNNVGIEEVPAWPGVRFDSGSQGYLALMGSPNGLATGYFLTQHKRQMGENKYVAFIIVFKEDDPTGFPSLLFSVKSAPSPPPPPPPEDENAKPKDPKGGMERLSKGRQVDSPTGKVLRRSQDGRQLVREHVVWAE